VSCLVLILASLVNRTIPLPACLALRVIPLPAQSASRIFPVMRHPLVLSVLLNTSYLIQELANLVLVIANFVLNLLVLNAWRDMIYLRINAMMSNHLLVEEIVYCAR
jgi:hypothetical protein